MADYRSLSSLSDIRHLRDLNEDNIRDILRAFYSDYGLIVLSMGTLEDMSGLNDAFNSSIVSLRVLCKRSDESEAEFNFVIKSPPKMSFIRQMHKLIRPFYNEVSWYLDCIPQLESLHGQGCLDSIVPKCYHAYSTHGVNSFICPWFCSLPFISSEKGILILENVSHRSFLMFDKRIPLPLDHVILTFSELAHFHGKWLTWKYHAQDKTLGDKAWSFETFVSHFNTQKRIPILLYKQLVKVAKKTTIKILRKEKETDNIERIRNFFDKTALASLKEYLRREDESIYTLCHGDCWSNNILFSYNEDRVNTLNFIDFQLINYGHPCYDLVYFIYLSTDLSFRDSHLSEVLKLYFDIFSTYLYSVKLTTYSYDNFVADYQDHRKIGFTTACSVLPNVLSNAPMNIEATGIWALRELGQKQERELNDDFSVSAIEIRKRIKEMVFEMARDSII